MPVQIPRGIQSEEIATPIDLSQQGEEERQISLEVARRALSISDEQFLDIAAKQVPGGLVRRASKETPVSGSRIANRVPVFREVNRNFFGERQWCEILRLPLLRCI